MEMITFDTFIPFLRNYRFLLISNVTKKQKSELLEPPLHGRSQGSPPPSPIEMLPRIVNNY